MAIEIHDNKPNVTINNKKRLHMFNNMHIYIFIRYKIYY